MGGHEPGHKLQGQVDPGRTSPGIRSGEFTSLAGASGVKRSPLERLHPNRPGEKNPLKLELFPVPWCRIPVQGESKPKEFQDPWLFSRFWVV